MADNSDSDGRSEFDWETFVIDDDFARGGTHEPPARTREAIARYRHLEQPGPLGRTGTPRRRHRSRLVRVGIPLFLVVVAVVGTMLWTNRSPTPGAGGAPGGTSTPPSEVFGLDRTSKVGNCYSGKDPADATPNTLHTVNCSDPHRWELFALEKATGDGSTFPQDSYWAGFIQTCGSEVPAYTGDPLTALPASVQVRDFQPTPSGWKVGDRTVYCMLTSQTPATTSLRKQ